MRNPASAVTLVLAVSALACSQGSQARAADAIPAYQLDTLAWVRQDRPVVFRERGWVRTGTPVKQSDVVRVGQFEGMALYASSDETVPYEHLFVPVGGNRWQTLRPMSRAAQPVAGAGAAAGTLADTARNKLQSPRTTPPKRHVRHD